jgi:dihydropteroate synthase
MQLICRDRLLNLEQPQVMGVFNITPDSFSDAGRWLNAAGEPCLQAVLDAANAMLGAGAAILDVGGESTRPAASPLTPHEERDRVMPVVEALVSLDTIVSVDTSSALVAREALAAGAHLINDVRALRDPDLFDIVAESDAAVCLMHMQGEPRTMQEQPVYADVLNEVREFLAERVRRCRAAGLSRGQIAIDPGFGFGKTLDHNLELLGRLSELHDVNDLAGLPILVGLSRKSMIGALTGQDIDQRDVASAAIAGLAVMQGAAIIRTHNVAATLAAVQVATGLRDAQHRKKA